MGRRLQGNDRQRERQVQSQTAGRIASRMRERFQASIQRAMMLAADAFEADSGSDSGLGIVRMEHRASMEEALVSEWRIAAEAGGRRILAEAKRAHGPLYRKGDPMDDQFSQRVREILAGDVMRRAAQLSESTIRDIRARIQRGIRDGRNVDQIAAEIRQKAPQISAYRSMMISRTESHTAYNAGHQAAAAASDLIIRREWVSAQDERTRANGFDHLAADGETVGAEEAFVETGERLLYPGDPSGSPGNIIHCRCGVADIIE